MSRIVAVAPVLPPHRYRQAEVTEALAATIPGADRSLLERVHRSAGVSHRNLALPIEEYAGLRGFGAANDAFIQIGSELGARAVRAALGSAGLAPDEVDIILTTSVTGIAAPSLDARLVETVGLRDDIRRLPSFGLGCVAGAAGTARVHDLLRGDPDAVAILLSVELCSLTVQRDDVSTANLVGSGLFGDGAAALVMVGERRAQRLGRPGPTIVDSRSRLYPGTDRVLGWDVVDSGFRLVLAPGLSELVESSLGADLGDFLAGHDLKADDVIGWVVHPGGPKVLDAVTSALGLPAEALARSRESLRQVGNLSSASVLHVLADLMRDPPPPDSPGVMLAMGPGFSVEMVLMRW
jgi:alkylresorcinol/alkylpyrone synthase